MKILWLCSSKGRALALHARGTGIDVPHLQNICPRLREVCFVVNCGKSKTNISCILFTSYLNAWRVQGCSPKSRALAASLACEWYVDRWPASPKHFLKASNNYVSLLPVANWKIKLNEYCWQARSKLEEHLDIAQMVEHLLCKREVRGSMCRISNTFAQGFENYASLLTVANQKLIFHAFCSQASSTPEEYGDVAQIVER